MIMVTHLFHTHTLPQYPLPMSLVIPPSHPTLSIHPLIPSSHPTLSSHPLIPPSHPTLSTHLLIPPYQGRSLYSELAHSIPDALDRNSVKEHAMKSVHEYSSHHGRRNIISSLHGVSAHNRSRHGTSRDALSGMVEGEESRRVRVLTTTATATATTTTTTPAASSRSGDIVGQGQGKDLTTITEEEGEYGHAGEQRV